MSVLKNPQRELFAQARAAGKSIADANNAAGYGEYVSGHGSTGHRIGRSQEVIDRIAEIQAEVAKNCVTTALSLIIEAEMARVLAMETKNPLAAIAAIKEKGILAGVRIEKHESLNRNVEQLTDDELAAYLTTNGSARDTKPKAH